MSATEPTATPQQGRDSHGRFTKGNRGGPGNPHARQVAALRQRLLAKVTTEEMDAIIDALLLRAREGDVAAAKLILQYTLGRPLEARNPERLDADEVDAFHANALTNRSAELVNLHTLELILPLFRILIGARSQGDMQQFAEAFTRTHGPDGQGKPAGKQQPAPATPPAPTAEPTPTPQVAPPPKPAAVSKRKETAAAPPRSLLPDLLLTALLGTPAELFPPPADTKREPTECRSPNEAPHEADRQQTVDNGDAAGRPAPPRPADTPIAA